MYCPFSIFHSNIKEGEKNLVQTPKVVFTVVTHKSARWCCVFLHMVDFSVRGFDKIYIFLLN